MATVEQGSKQLQGAFRELRDYAALAVLVPAA